MVIVKEDTTNHIYVPHQKIEVFATFLTKFPDSASRLSGGGGHSSSCSGASDFKVGCW